MELVSHSWYLAVKSYFRVKVEFYQLLSFLILNNIKLLLKYSWCIILYATSVQYNDSQYLKFYSIYGASLVAQLAKNLPVIKETPVRLLDQEILLEKGIGYPHQYSWASLLAKMVKNLSAIRRYKRHWFNPWVRNVPWRRGWRTLQSSCLENSHGQRMLMGYSPWSHKELNMTEWPSTAQHAPFLKCSSYKILRFPWTEEAGRLQSMG